MKRDRAVSIRGIHVSMAIIILIAAILLMFATIRTKIGYSRMRQNTEDYLQWEQDVGNLQLASDYLTEQVRCFVETGEREYLDNYFEEANVTRRREKALESIRQIAGDSEACASLEAAMNESVALMDKEYYAMRLAVEAHGYDVARFPEAIRAVALSEEEAQLTPVRKDVLARKAVFDDAYRQTKERISQNVQACLTTLASGMDEQQRATTAALDEMMINERTLIIITISVTLLTLLLTTFLVISPLVRAVVYIRADQPIPIKGSNEFQFLARTYNLMYQANQEKTQKLTYDATHDQLTGIHNRAGYVFFLKNTDWESSALLLFDVDKFKGVNDSYGHEAGDNAIKRVADALRASFRAQDHVCRIGGDEFAVIMVHTNPDHFELVKNKVARLNETLGAPRDGQIPIHVSCGVAYGDAAQDTEDIFRRADAALYQVKAAGGCDCRVGEAA